MTIESRIENGAVMIDWAFTARELLDQLHGKERRADLAARYSGSLAHRHRALPCTLRINSPVAGAIVNHRIRRLLLAVRDAGQTLRVEGYPPDYMAGVTALGLDKMPGVTFV